MMPKLSLTLPKNEMSLSKSNELVKIEPFTMALF